MEIFEHISTTKYHHLKSEKNAVFRKFPYPEKNAYGRTPVCLVNLYFIKMIELCHVYQINHVCQYCECLASKMKYSHHQFVAQGISKY